MRKQQYLQWFWKQRRRRRFRRGRGAAVAAPALPQQNHQIMNQKVKDARLKAIEIDVEKNISTQTVCHLVTKRRQFLF